MGWRHGCLSDDPADADENRIPLDAKDSRGNPVQAILNIDDTIADLLAGGRSSATHASG